MSTTPTLPGTEPEISPEEEAILRERLKTLGRDERDSVDARQALADIRKALKHLKPR